MSNINAVALFCEDVRTDSSGSFILTGIMSDGLAVQAFPGVIPKLGVFARVNVPVDADPVPIKIVMRGDNLPDFPIADFSAGFIEASQKGVVDGAPFTGLIAGGAGIMVQIPGAGHIRVDCSIGEITSTIAFLRILPIDAPINHHNEAQGIDLFDDLLPGF